MAQTTTASGGRTEKHATPQRKSSAKPAAKSSKSSSKKSHAYESYDHSFPPGTEIQVFEATEVEEARRYNREPQAKSVAKATVNDEGLLKLSVPKKGQYQAVGEVTVSSVSGADTTAQNIQPYDEYRYFGFSIK